MYFVAGSNIFTQWLPTSSIFPEFRRLLRSRCNIPINQAKLVFMHWSYNIFLIEGTYYITGAFYGKENLRIIKLPEECDPDNVRVAGNDYKIVVVGKNTLKFWVINLEKMEEVKKIELSIEWPLENSKKMKLGDQIIKMSLMNDSCIFLTECGHVYTGLLPTYVDTKHCIGKVIDVVTGYEHFILLTDAGNLYTWGQGGRLQLGHGDLESVEAPKIVEALAGVKIVKIKCGGWHSLALSNSGDAYIWGWNDSGQLGIDEIEADDCLYLPVVVEIFYKTQGNVNIKEIACGSKHTAVLLDDNSLWVTGYNKYGQLGLSPEQYPIIKKFRRVRRFPKDVHLRCGPWNTVINSVQ